MAWIWNALRLCKNDFGCHDYGRITKSTREAYQCDRMKTLFELKKEFHN